MPASASRRRLAERLAGVATPPRVEPRLQRRLAAPPGRM